MEESVRAAGSWQEWVEAVTAQSRGREASVHAELEGELVCPVYHPARPMESAGTASDQGWLLRGSVESASGVMPALEGGAEVLRCIGCDDPEQWMAGVMREYVEIEFIGGIDIGTLAETGTMPVRGGVLLDWWSTSGTETIQAHVQAVSKLGSDGLRAVSLVDPRFGNGAWSTAASLALLFHSCTALSEQLNGLERVAMDVALDADPIVSMASVEAMKLSLIHI